MKYIPQPLQPQDEEGKVRYLATELDKIGVAINELDERPSGGGGGTSLHEDLTDVTADQHHPQLHNIGSHTDVAITDLKVGQGLIVLNDGVTFGNRSISSESWPTGLAQGGELNIGPGINDIEVIAGLGLTVDSYTDPLSPPVGQLLQWPQINTPITAAPAVAGSVVWFSIQDTGVPTTPIGNNPVNVGSLQQYSSGPTPTVARKEIFLGIAVHNGTTWNEVSNPKVINQVAETLREIAINVLPLSSIISGGGVTELPAFQVEQALGVIWEQNRNWHVDKSNPNREELLAQSPVTFKYVNRDFTNVGAFTSTFDPSLYDGGTGAPIAVPGPANNTTIQRLYLDPAGNYWVLWGQYIYANFFTAVANLATDSAKTIVPPILNSSILLGYSVSEQAKTDWDPNEAVFVPLGSENAGSGGGVAPITDHNLLNGIGPNDHHNEFHGHTGLDGSGVVSYDDLTNKPPAFTPTTFTGAGSTGYVPDPLVANNFYLRDDGVWAEVAGTGASEVSWIVTQIGHGFTPMKAVHHTGTQYILAQANNEDTTAAGLVIEVIDANTFRLAQVGQYAITSGLTVGQFYYVSSTVAGDLSSTEPDLGISGNYSQPLAYIVDASTIQVLSYRPMTSGDVVVGPEGPQGPVGEKGDQGDIGPPGVDGNSLPSADVGNVIILGSDDLLYYSGAGFTPTTFAGAGTTGYVADPGSESGKFLSDSGAWVDAAAPDTGYIVPSLLNTFTLGYAQYRKIGNAVYINIAVDRSAIAPVGTPVFVLPEGFRPTNNYVIGFIGAMLDRNFVRQAYQFTIQLNGSVDATWPIAAATGSTAGPYNYAFTGVFFV